MNGHFFTTIALCQLNAITRKVGTMNVESVVILVEAALMSLGQHQGKASAHPAVPLCIAVQINVSLRLLCALTETLGKLLQ